MGIEEKVYPFGPLAMMPPMPIAPGGSTGMLGLLPLPLLLPVVPLPLARVREERVEGRAETVEAAAAVADGVTGADAGTADDDEAASGRITQWIIDPSVMPCPLTRSLLFNTRPAYINRTLSASTDICVATFERRLWIRLFGLVDTDKSFPLIVLTRMVMSAIFALSDPTKTSRSGAFSPGFLLRCS
jgi:hypothetical protein